MNANWLTEAKQKTSVKKTGQSSHTYICSGSPKCCIYLHFIFYACLSEAMTASLRCTPRFLLPWLLSSQGMWIIIPANAKVFG